LPAAQRRERAAQVLACAVQPRLDRADVRIDRSRDLGERQAFVLGEDHHLALERPQRAHSPADNVADFAAIEIDGLRDDRLVVERLEAMFLPPVLEREVPAIPSRKARNVPRAGSNRSGYRRSPTNTSWVMSSAAAAEPDIRQTNR
jgi:hypothetical protein